MQRVVQSEQFEAAWVEANTLVHQRLNAALSGENVDNALQVENNQVVLDLSDLITQVKQRLVDRGLTVAENIPATTSASIVLFNVPNATSLQTATPAQRRRLLAAADRDRTCGPWHLHQSPAAPGTGMVPDSGFWSR